MFEPVNYLEVREPWETTNFLEEFSPVGDFQTTEALDKSEHLTFAIGPISIAFLNFTPT